MAGELEALTGEVQETSGIIDSAIALIGGISGKIQDAVDAALAANPGVDLTALTALKEELNTKSEALAAAVAANA